MRISLRIIILCTSSYAYYCAYSHILCTCCQLRVILHQSHGGPPTQPRIQGGVGPLWKCKPQPKNDAPTWPRTGAATCSANKRTYAWEAGNYQRPNNRAKSAHSHGCQRATMFFCECGRRRAVGDALTDELFNGIAWLMCARCIRLIATLPARFVESPNRINILTKSRKTSTRQVVHLNNNISAPTPTRQHQRNSAKRARGGQIPRSRWRGCTTRA